MVRTDYMESKSCVIWVPCITHEFLKPSISIDNKRIFRISDFFLSVDNESNKYELWGKVFLSSGDFCKFKEDDFTRYNLTIVISKNTNKKCIDRIQKVNSINKFISKYPYANLFIGRYYSWSINKIDSISIEDSDLLDIFMIELKCIYASHNGMLVFKYEIPQDIPESYNIFDEGELPPCIYHNIKELFHSHEFHDNERDAVLTPFYPNKGLNGNIDEVLLMAVEHNLKEFQQEFIDRMQYFKSLYQRKHNFIRKPALFGILIICIILLNVKLLNVEWFQYISILLNVVLILASIDALLNWRHKYSTFLPKELLSIKGEHAYVLSLKRSKYIKNNDDCRRLVHNINNVTNVAIHYMDAIITRGNNSIAIIGIILAVLIFFTQLLLTLAIDYSTTNAIDSVYRAVERLEWYVRM